MAKHNKSSGPTVADESTTTPPDSSTSMAAGSSPNEEVNFKTIIEEQNARIDSFCNHNSILTAENAKAISELDDVMNGISTQLSKLF